MATVVFYEKPGCEGNARQKDILLRAGHELDVRDLIAHPWTAGELLAFLSEEPVADWFNRQSPRVKSGEVVPDRMGAREALELLLADHALIRRPLLQVGDRRQVGFLLNVVAQWIGVDPLEPEREGSLEGCGASQGKPCSPAPRSPAPLRLVKLGRQGA